MRPAAVPLWFGTRTKLAGTRGSAGGRGRVSVCFDGIGRASGGARRVWRLGRSLAARLSLRTRHRFILRRLSQTTNQAAPGLGRRRAAWELGWASGQAAQSPTLRRATTDDGLVVDLRTAHNTLSHPSLPLVPRLASRLVALSTSAHPCPFRGCTWRRGRARPPHSPGRSACGDRC